MHSMTNIVQLRVVDRLADVLDGLLGVRRRHDLVLARRDLVRRQDTDLTSRHLLLVDHDRLSDVVHLRLHLAEIVGLQIEQLDIVRCECVDLIGDRCERLCCEVLCFFERRFFVFRADGWKWSVKTRASEWMPMELTDNTSLRSTQQLVRDSGRSPSGSGGLPGGPA